MRTADFNFVLPPDLIAQEPVPKRDESRLLVLQRKDGHIEHRKFRDLLEFLRAGDVLVLNNSRVISRKTSNNAKRRSAGIRRSEALSEVEDCGAFMTEVWTSIATISV